MLLWVYQGNLHRISTSNIQYCKAERYSIIYGVLNSKFELGTLLF